jgi:hypothetical protein
VGEIDDLQAAVEHAVVQLLATTRRLLDADVSAASLTERYLEPTSHLLAEFDLQALLATAGDEVALEALRRIARTLAELSEAAIREAAD